MLEDITSKIETITDKETKISLYLDLIILTAQQSEHLKRIVYEYCQEDMACEYNRCVKNLYEIKKKIIEIIK